MGLLRGGAPDPRSCSPNCVTVTRAKEGLLFVVAPHCLTLMRQAIQRGREVHKERKVAIQSISCFWLGSCTSAQLQKGPFSSPLSFDRPVFGLLYTVDPVPSSRPRSSDPIQSNQKHSDYSLAEPTRPWMARRTLPAAALTRRPSRPACPTRPGATLSSTTCRTARSARSLWTVCAPNYSCLSPDRARLSCRSCPCSSVSGLRSW